MTWILFIIALGLLARMAGEGFGSMTDQLIQKVEQIQVPVGYGVSAGLTTTPVWLDTLTGILELVAVCFAVLVGYTTWRLNIAKRRKLEQDENKD